MDITKQPKSYDEALLLSDKPASCLAVILAAGEGTRMKSKRPKVCHSILGRPLVSWVARTLWSVGCSEVLAILGRQAHEVEALLDQEAKESKQNKAQVILQTERKGTGHALIVAQDALKASTAQSVLVISGDSPLLLPQSIADLINLQQSKKLAAALLSFYPENPFGYGRIIRTDSGLVQAIIEQKDCTHEQAQVTECNSGVYCFDKEALLSALPSLKPNNAQGEYYLTDVIAYLSQKGYALDALSCQDPQEALGVNSREQLAQATAVMQKRINAYHMAQGVSMLDPQTVWIEPQVRIGADSFLYPMTFLSGQSSLAEDCIIGPNTQISNSSVGRACHIEESIVRSAQLEDEVSVGPRAYIRPGTHMQTASKAGCHVELKNTQVGPGSKVPHLSYMGDAIIGKEVNIGAGSITCNYDGKNKHTTEIGDHAFVGSDTMLVAPVRLGAYSVTGAGSTITHDVSDKALGIARAKQEEIANYRKDS